MADFGDSTVYGDLRVTGKIIGNGAGGAGGILMNAADLGIANNSDNMCVGGAIYMLSADPDTAYPNFIVANFEGLTYGAYSVMLRLAFSSGASANTDIIVKIESFHVVGTTETLLNTAYIRVADFTDSINYDVFGIVTNFKGTAGTSSPILRVKLSYLAYTYEESLFFDYIRVSPAYTSVFSLPTT